MSTDRNPNGIEHVVLNIRLGMTRHGLTQAQLAELLGMSQVSVSKRLRGVTPITVPELLIVADALKVSPAELLSESAA